jgi:hypothetical protein
MGAVIIEIEKEMWHGEQAMAHFERFVARRLHGRHPERSRLSGVVRDLARSKAQTAHARSLSRLKYAGFCDYAFEGSQKIQTEPPPGEPARQNLVESDSEPL